MTVTDVIYGELLNGLKTWPVVERTVGPELIIFSAPLLYQHCGLGKRIEYFPIKQFIPQFPVKRLYVTILPGAAAFDEKGSNSYPGKPSTYLPGCEFGAVVRAYVLRDAPKHEELKQLVDDIL